MSDLKDLLQQQQETCRSIDRALDNFKKVGRGNYTYGLVRNRLSNLKDHFTKCQQLHNEILSITSPESRSTLKYFKDDAFFTMEDTYLTTTDYMTDILVKVEPLASSGAAGRSAETVITPHGDVRPSSSDQLPRLNLPIFSGNIEEWESFRDRFKAMIVGNQTLSDVSRLQYLLSCVKGESSDIIRNLAITDANFRVAWDMLVKRYENKRRLITTHIQSLLNLPQASSETTSAINGIRDRANLAIQALKNLGCSVDTWNEILVFLVINRLDKESRRAWELKLGSTLSFPSYTDLDEFLETRVRALEAMLPVTFAHSTKGSNLSLDKSFRRSKTLSHATTSKTVECPLCKSSHILGHCPTFKSKSLSQRVDYVKQSHRCINCLSVKHTIKECPSSYTCQKCQKRHHTLLHFGESPPTIATTDHESPSTSAVEPKAAGQVTSLSVSKASVVSSQILLATAWIKVSSSSGRTQRIRALLDQGSAISLITENLAQRLRTARSRISISITGIGNTETSCKTSTILTVASCKRTGVAYSTTALILKSLSHYSPYRTNGNHNWVHIHGLDLADETPFSSDPIEMIIGADIYGLLLLNGIRKGAPNEPVAQNTTLGWILSGPVPSPTSKSSLNLHIHHCFTSESLDSELRRFWEIEELPSQTHWTLAEQRCEEHFVKTHTRASNGQYIVRLPFIQGPPIDIGPSLSLAKILWSRQEQRLQNNASHAAEYSSFMREYKALGHMTELREPIPVPEQANYIPHHAVIRESSATTPLRVVFNASCKTANGTALNDHLLVGPKLQTDLPAIALQWRLHRYVYTADIAKMYRQIIVDDRDVDFQRVLWRPSLSEPLRHYKLLTVTYGTAPAPYLAQRVLKQLVISEGSNYPLALPVLQNHTYVDDCVFGAYDLTLARQTRDQLIALLRKAGFTLRKWASNASALLSDIDPADHGLASWKSLQPDDSLKILGLNWNPETDSFRFNIAIEDVVPRTKRTILSTIAKLFDPLGWATPVVIVAKILMQQIWRQNCNWDDCVSPGILSKWTAYYRELPHLQGITLKRWTQHEPDAIQCELHGFADASASAYAAVVFLRIVTRSGNTVVTLLAAKSKVAPLKSLSIPRLELCAALLLSRLVIFVQSSLSLPDLAIHCWTDSTIALAWISQHPSRWKIFVANRVTEIQSNLPVATWHHVPTESNPADCASRGLDVSTFAQHSLWWNDPDWLKEAPELWPSDTSQLQATIPLEEQSNIPVSLTIPTEPWDVAKHLSHWMKLIRVTAYIFRFISRIRSRFKAHNSNVAHDNQPQHVLSPRALTSAEIQKARIFWLKYIQHKLFATEICHLNSNRPLPTRSTLLSLNVYLDNDGLLRVGDRLRNSLLQDDAKHPIVLASHPLVSLLISYIHIHSLHAGPHLTLAILRQEFWLLRARPTIRAVLYRCVTCARERAAIPSELMGDLPAVRVTRAERAFLHVGVDYAGPVLVRTTPGRGHRSSKAYIALFICMTTRAIHLELVGDYSTTAFLACLNRFFSRRGLATAMYSDNGTTFQGAEKELTASFRAATRDPDVLNRLASDRVSWHFIPPSAPHFGGLWEAGVRSMKHHIKRIIGAHTLTFEEFTTVLCQIEACLNSRPIASQSDNFDDYSALTPGHFLIGSAITTVPTPTLLDVNASRLSRWQLLQQFFESFWRAWSNDYINTLQQRVKWRAATNLATPGRIVLLRNSLLPPCKWELARIVQCHPGPDGLTRVVTIKTSKSEYKRPITKLCFLPVDINTQSAANAPRAGGDVL